MSQVGDAKISCHSITVLGTLKEKIVCIRSRAGIWWFASTLKWGVATTSPNIKEAPRPWTAVQNKSTSKSLPNRHSTFIVWMFLNHSWGEQKGLKTFSCQIVFFKKSWGNGFGFVSNPHSVLHHSDRRIASVFRHGWRKTTCTPLLVLNIELTTTDIPC